MKKILVTFAFVSAVAALSAQDTKRKDEIPATQIPAEVASSFHKDFPTASGAWWKKEDGGYEATFKVDQSGMSALYSKSGYRKEVERDIDERDLPPGVFDYIKKNYAGAKLQGATKVTSDKGVITYEAQITKDGKFNELIFDSAGRYKKKE